MEEVHTCPDVRYWSEVLYYTIPTHISDPEVTEVTNIENKICLSFWLKFLEPECDSGEPHSSAIALIISIFFFFFFFCPYLVLIHMLYICRCIQRPRLKQRQTIDLYVKF